jgi:hypothetical protein
MMQDAGAPYEGDLWGMVSGTSTETKEYRSFLQEERECVVAVGTKPLRRAVKLGKFNGPIRTE